ncbi:MAG: uroporphyrinogen-III synthase [Rhizobiaceae bacterium]|nr:uroporphyrinogen-III synthase [Rhizobiaceae bacterium]
MAGRILVTRPEPAATRTVGRLAQMGLEAVSLPLTETVGIAVDRSAMPLSADAVAVTSGNALLHAPDDLLARYLDVACFAVGTRTAREAHARGFTTVVAGPGDAVGLARLLVDRTSVGQTVLFLCGRERLDRIESILRAASRTVVPVETYDTRDLAPAPGAGPDREHFEAVLLYSVRASSQCAGLISQGRFSASRLLCLSPRIAGPVGRLPGQRVQVAAAPSEAALLDLLAPAAKGS